MAHELIGITVSVHCTSVLSLVLPVNREHFTRWYIVTDPDDSETIRMCQKSEPWNLSVLTFNFFNNAIFNKGGGIRVAQKIAHSQHPLARILVLDSDIILPVNFNEIWQSLPFREDTLFGAAGRHDYPSASALLMNDYEEYKYGHYFTGYFQLYSDKEKFYQASTGIDKCDDLFRDSFLEKQMINNLFIRHLGKSGYGTRYLTNPNQAIWDGKKSKPRFEMDNPLDPADLEYHVQIRSG